MKLSESHAVAVIETENQGKFRKHVILTNLNRKQSTAVEKWNMEISCLMKSLCMTKILNFPTVGPKRSEHCPGPSEGLKISGQTRKESLLRKNILLLLTYLPRRALRFRRLYCLISVPGAHSLALLGFDSSFCRVTMSEGTVCPRRGGRL
jgi:hypothetical protein